MDTLKTATQKPVLEKDQFPSSGEDELDSYSDLEDLQEGDNEDELNQMSESDFDSPGTSDTQSIQREIPPQGHRYAPTTTISRKESSSVIPKSKGIAPIQPLSERSESGKKVEKGADSALSLRLDLNLDIEIELKAKIKGDLTLTLMLVLNSTNPICSELKICRA